ncbi:CLUMA_CG019388, isoform A [Clunio marinus]|uniref:CLUMA_CG019388, isoform A n=1 Tax=Clunio marinus TaxID=568069 RepID=A0A1J1J636_9DIPT|nr:CLUMA_CG019388, isoform A [Clunio marinus]
MCESLPTTNNCACKDDEMIAVDDNDVWRLWARAILRNHFKYLSKNDESNKQKKNIQTILLTA